MVLADMKLAAETPTDVVLFNIDSKSDTGSKQNKDAIVNVFLRVFNEMQGFCGSLPHLADLEQQLTEAGRMDEFKEAFEDEYGKPWEENRHKFDFIQDTVVDVLVDMDFMSESAARNWCEKASEPYQISIEDFAKRVKAYINAKGKNHHVVFLVDEIGQYIGEDSKLMLNLQTVTEELGKECQGKAWVIVTSQQDIDSVTKVKGNDFSKIQGRFDTRLSLSSANVDAVIKKRILDKTDTAAQTLRLLYDQKATIIKNLIVFNDGVEKKLYANASDFSEVYPFVPYQFNLLASVLTSIRTHGASGKHLSEGERSMLALFKESAAKLKDEEMGVIIPFHLFYDALENFLDHSHRGVIIRAYDNTKINPEHKESDVFAINVLKTLFMIKYVLEIEANIDNITSLMPKKKPETTAVNQETVDSLKQEIEQLHNEAEELKRQVYRLQLEKDVLEKAAEILKKDEGVSLEKLTNREKATVIGALRSKYKLRELLDVFHMAKSSYCYQQAALNAPDKYADLRTKIRAVFDESSSRYGYRRIHSSLKSAALTVSEKVVRRIMREDNLIVPNIKRKKYNSYKGEITPAVPNMIERDFHADQPNMKWLTDITEFHIPAGKIYLSPIIDCFDGLPVSWTIGTSPDAELVNTMLDNAIGTLLENEHPIVHSDRGAHYRWPGWIERMENAGLTRSMSKKGCSPDNSACEGFFGRLKNEMFYGRSWKEVTIEDFIEILDVYIHWYSEKRIKLSLGGLSPLQYRRSLGLIAA